MSEAFVSCTAPGCRCEFHTLHDLVQHLKHGKCGPMKGGLLIRRIPFSRQREDMQSILYQRRFASGVRMSSPRNQKIESGDASQKIL